MKEALSLQGRAAIVSGGGGGIGSAVVERLAHAGADVTSLDLQPGPAPPGVRSIACDVGDPAAVDAAVAEVCTRCGRLDVVVHCAGITRDGMLWKLDGAAWDDVIRTNLTSAFFLLKAATPGLRERGGAVVLVSSINGERGKLGQSNYSASKAGLIALGKTAARELGRFDVRVNTVAPGITDTPMTQKLPEDVRARALDETVLGRIGMPGDVADAVLFLCSSLSRHITGQVLRVDGGQLMA